MKYDLNNLQSNRFYLDNPDNFMKILDLCNNSSRFKKKILEDKLLVRWIDEMLPLLKSEFYSLETKIHWIFNDIHQFPSCQGCHHVFSDRNVQTINKGYPKYCSHSCAVNSNEVKEKTKQTCLDRYGVSSPGQSLEIKQKSKKTCLKKYGVEYSLQSNVVKQKAKETIQSRYGVDSITAVDEIKNKIKTTKLEKYGDDQPWHSKEALSQRKTNWMKKYGVDHPQKSEKIRNKLKDTLLERYGVDHISKINGFSSQIRRKYSYEEIMMKNEFDVPCFSLDEYLLSLNDSSELKFKCKKCQKEFLSKHYDGHHKKCPTCYPVERSTSNEEKELINFIREFENDLVENDRTTISPLELDVYIPSKRLAFEFDGLYWHSDINNKDIKYHLNKTELCEKQGIHLIHIFENEWIYKQDIVKSRIKNLLGIYDQIVFARKCEIREVDSKTSREFQDQNHIQGAVNSKVNVGLYFEDELISLMTFSKPRFDKKHEWELVRFCNKLGYHVPGAASRLLKYFERNYNPISLVSYADRRWSQGNVYEKLGFKLDHVSKPDYWYWTNKFLELESRIKFQKHKLKNILERFDESKTEVENMKDNGYFRIFDCGNLVYEKVY